MIKVNEWVNYVRFDEVPDDGIFICQPTDSVLDPDCWPIWSITMLDGKIMKQNNLYTAPHGGYQSTKMEGWTKVQLVEWLQYEEHTSGAEQSNNMMWLGYTPEKPKPEPYWFCAAIDTPVERELVLLIMSYYKVRGYALGNGDMAQIMVIDEETREGDLQLAEMAFNATGTVVWRQAKVCPLCESEGETICGHMYFYKAVKSAF